MSAIECKPAALGNWLLRLNSVRNRPQQAVHCVSDHSSFELYHLPVLRYIQGMTPELTLHTFGRRYCMKRHTYWCNEYARIVEAGQDRHGEDYTDTAYAVFPRYNVLRAILQGAEALDPERLPDARTLTDLLINIGRSTSADTSDSLSNPIEHAAEQEERDLFVVAIETAANDGLLAQEPLFYRRILNAREVEETWRHAVDKWGVTEGYWFPLNDRTHPSLVALELDSIDETKLQNSIRRFFADASVGRIYELREHGPENYLVDAGIDDIQYDGAEGYWFSKANDWIIYCSHENTITLGGTIADIAREGVR